MASSPSNCSACDAFLAHTKDKMTHIEQLRKEVIINEEDRAKLIIKIKSLEQEKAWLEKDNSFLTRESCRIRDENEKLMKKLQEKHVACLENERLLDIIYKDRDECINEKMKVSRFYRSEMKKLSEDNMDLRKENNYLRKKNEEQLVKDAFENSEVKEEVLPKDVLFKLVNTISDDRKQNVHFHEEFEKTRQQMESLLENMSRLERTIHLKSKESMKDVIHQEVNYGVFDENLSSIQTSPKYGNGEEKEVGCSCPEQHRTLEQLLACPDLDKRIREELDQAKCDESVKDEESEGESEEHDEENDDEDDEETAQVERRDRFLNCPGCGKKIQNDQESAEEQMAARGEYEHELPEFTQEEAGDEELSDNDEVAHPENEDSEEGEQDTSFEMVETQIDN